MLLTLLSSGGIARTGTANGTSNQTTTVVLTALRTATAAGSGTATAVGGRIVFATATATGQGTATASRTITRLREAAVVGQGTATVVYRRDQERTGTAVGIGDNAIVWTIPVAPLPPPAPTNQGKVRGRPGRTTVIAQVPVVQARFVEAPQTIQPVLVFDFELDDETLMCLA